jgi:outer membrane protein TolC
MTKKKFSIIKHITLAFLLFYLPQIAAADPAAQLQSLILNTGDVQTARNEYLLSKVNVKVREAETMPQVSAYTNSNLSIAREVDRRNAVRFTDEDLDYFDVVTSVEHNLYDFGKAENEISALSSRSDAARLRFLEAFERELDSLLQERLTADVETIRTSILQNLVTELLDFEKRANNRFRSGVGTLAEAREVSLLILDAQNNLAESEKRQAELLQRMKARYGSVPESPDVSFFAPLGEKFDQVELAPTPNSLQALMRAQEGFEFETKALEVSRMPTFDLGGRLTIIDVTRGLNEYDMTVGVTVRMPLYDGGANAARQTELSYRKQIEEQKKRAILQDKSQKLEVILLDRTRLLEKMTNAQDRLKTIAEKLRELDIRRDATGTSINELAETIVDQANAKIVVETNPLEVLKLLVAQHGVTETLLSALNIAPNPERF